MCRPTGGTHVKEATRSARSLEDPTVARALCRLHRAARDDRWRFALKAPAIGAALLRGSFPGPDVFKDFYLPVTAEQGRFLYLTARAIGARRIVEFGTSFGISTLYLAAAVRDNGGGEVIGTEIEPSKAEVARRNFEEAGLADVVNLRVGDARESLAGLQGPVDLLLLDGWKDLYLPLLLQLKPALRPGAVVLADNIFTFKKSLAPFVEYMQSPQNGFTSTTLKLSDGLEYAVYSP